MGIKAFVKKAVSNPAVCQIKIAEIASMCEALISGLVEMRIRYIQIQYAGTGLGAPGVDFPKFRAEAAKALEKELFGVCPKCHLVTNGEQLIRVYNIRKRIRREVGSFAFDPPIAIAMATRIAAELPECAELLKDKCRHANCNCREILIFWRPRESKKLTKRLAKMGIKI
ncbi:MAG TPA: hypothetical protein HA348_06665 [Thermoplasmata archaeon]|nr:hypothetical protein [Thermoplasmata archaeon]